MKTNVFAKLAVVAMAAFGAFAFNGNSNKEAAFKRGDTCEDIYAECDLNGDFNCFIEVNNQAVPIMDLQCESQLKHSGEEPVSWD